MGNCCEINTTLTDNEAENFIRECLHNLKIRRYGYGEFEEVILKLFKVSLVEITSDSLPKWISQENYNHIQNTYIFRSLNNSITESAYYSQKHTCFSYNEISSDENRLFFFLWSISLTKTKSKTEKVNAIERSITSNYSMLTFSTFKKFLIEYLNLILIKLTNNFEASERVANDIEFGKSYKRIVTKIFNIENLNRYVDQHMNILLNNFMIRKKNSLESNVNTDDYGNEFLNVNILLNFFKDNTHLLDVIELRNHFYIYYSSPFDNM